MNLDQFVSAHYYFNETLCKSVNELVTHSITWFRLMANNQFIDWFTQKHLDLFALWLGYVNSSINPFLYAFYNSTFRDGFRRLLCRGRCCLAGMERHGSESAWADRRSMASSRKDSPQPDGGITRGGLGRKIMNGRKELSRAYSDDRLARNHTRDVVLWLITYCMSLWLITYCMSLCFIAIIHNITRRNHCCLNRT